MDALEPLQACNNCKKIKEEYGRVLTLVGGFDNGHILNRSDVSLEEKRAEVLRVLDYMAPGGSYVAGFVSIRIEDMIPALDTVHEYNRAAYQEHGISYPPTKAMIEAIFSMLSKQR